MAHTFPTFAKLYGWVYILYLINHGFLAYWYPERLVGVHSSAVGYEQYERCNYMYAARNMALALLGLVALFKPNEKTERPF